MNVSIDIINDFKAKFNEMKGRKQNKVHIHEYWSLNEKKKKKKKREGKELIIRIMANFLLHHTFPSQSSQRTNVLNTNYTVPVI